MLHEKADFIFKLDEDMFICENYFSLMESSYKKIASQELCRIGYLSPVIPVNVFSYIPFLKKAGLETVFREKFGSDVLSIGGWALHWEREVTKFLWENSLPLDDKAMLFLNNKSNPEKCPYRFSIGAILLRRSLWKEMLGFEVGAEGEMGNDEVHISSHCMERFLCGYVDTNILTGHFAFGEQTDSMREFYESNKSKFALKRHNSSK